jgi:hypothetical protein
MLSTTLDKLREEGIREGIEKGIEKGRKEGIERGIEKGRREELVELIRIYLITRFDNAPADLDLLERLKNIEDIHELEKLVPQIYKCQNLEEIEMLSKVVLGTEIKNLLTGALDKLREDGIREGLKNNNPL